ncbi:MAG: glycoside hydrolase family 38 C-terminal domain-containing protein, partial [Candidatus Ratteibacteria bacterium]
LPALKYSNLNGFFSSVLRQRKKFPVVKDELQYHARGCYSAYYTGKRLNRMAENQILSTEAISTILWFFKKEKYPEQEIEALWHKILFNQFHDILAGSAILEGHIDSDRQLGQVIASSEEIINEKLWHFSSSINTEGEGTPVLFFNPTSFTREEFKEISFSDNYKIEDNIFSSPPDIDFFNEIGERVPSQSIEDPNSGIKNFVVKVMLPPFGTRVYWWRPSFSTKEHKKLVMQDHSLENDLLSMTLDEEFGGIKNLNLKTVNWSVFNKSGAEFLVIDDPGDTWGHGIDKYSNIIGKFRCTNIYQGEKGECFISLKCKMEFNKSEILLEYLLFDGMPFIEVRGKINWQEKNRVLKLSFPVNVENSEVFAEIPYAIIKRIPDGNENPCQRWVSICGKLNSKNYGLSIINQGWYGYDACQNELRMTVLRSPVFGSYKNPEVLRKEAFYDNQCIGINSIRYLILPFSGTINESSTQKIATFFNQQIEYILPLKHKGSVSSPFSFIKVEPENIVVTVLKKSVNDNSLVLRAYESYGKNTTARLEIKNKSFKVRFKRFEIKTFKFKQDKLEEVNLLEE